MRKTLSFILVLSLSFTMIGCGNKAASKKTDQVNDATVETLDIEQKEGGAVDVNKRLIDVEVTLPASFLGLDEEEVLDIDQIAQEAKEQGIKDVIVNDNGSITYIMSKSKHKEMMDEMQKGITETMDDLISGEDFTSYKDIIANKDFTAFDVVVTREEFEDSFDGFGILGLAFSSLYYQLFDGANPDDFRTVINMKDEATGEIFDTIIYPDALDGE